MDQTVSQEVKATCKQKWITSFTNVMQSTNTVVKGTAFKFPQIVGQEVAYFLGQGINKVRALRRKHIKMFGGIRQYKKYTKEAKRIHKAEAALESGD